MLERLNLEECKRLAEIDLSIGQLKCLVFLNLNFCRDLHYLPMELGELPALTELFLDGTSIGEIPSRWSMENLENPHVQISPSAKVEDLLNRLTSLSKLSLDETNYSPSRRHWSANKPPQVIFEWMLRNTETSTLHY